MRRNVHFLHIVGCDQACPVCSNNKEPRSPEKVELFCLFVACSYKSMETTALSCSFSWVLYGMLKVLRNNKLPISLERVKWFCWFFRVLICILLDIHWSCKKVQFWAGNVRHGLSANQITRHFKLKKLENYMRFHVDFLDVVR